MYAKLPAAIVALAPAKHLCCAAAVDQMGKASPASLLDGHPHEQALDLHIRSMKAGAYRMKQSNDGNDVMCMLST